MMSSSRRSSARERAGFTATAGAACSSCVFLSSTTLSAMAFSGGRRGLLRGPFGNGVLQILFGARQFADHALDRGNVEPLKHGSHHVLPKFGKPVHQWPSERREMQTL